MRIVRIKNNICISSLAILMGVDRNIISQYEKVNLVCLWAIKKREIKKRLMSLNLNIFLTFHQNV